MKRKNKWYQKISNWLIAIAFIILVPILAMNLYIMYQSQISKNEVPNVLGYKPFIVLSGSMESEIHQGDLIITKIIDPTTLKKDDVIAFRDSENTVTTHRIIELVEKSGTTYFVTKGDNNNTKDQNLVELTDVEGIYVTRIPGIGSIMMSLSQTSTIIILILGITVIFIIGFSISNKKQRDLEREEFLEFKKMKAEMAKMSENSKEED